MPLLLVDDRDGRVVAEIETEEHAMHVLDAWARDDGSIPEYLCLVELRFRHGAVLGTDSSITVRPLSSSADPSVDCIRGYVGRSVSV